MNSFNPALMAAEIGTVTIWLASVRKVRWEAGGSALLASAHTDGNIWCVCKQNWW